MLHRSLQPLLAGLLLTLLLAAASPAMAVYRCDADGKISYTDAPCAGGERIQVEVTSAKATEAAQRRVTNEKNQLAEIERAAAKLATENAKAQRRAARANAAERKRCDKLALRSKWTEEEASVAKGKSLEKALRKAQRAQEQYERECGEMQPQRDALVSGTGN